MTLQQAQLISSRQGSDLFQTCPYSNGEDCAHKGSERLLQALFPLYSLPLSLSLSFKKSLKAGIKVVIHSSLSIFSKVRPERDRGKKKVLMCLQYEVAG